MFILDETTVTLLLKFENKNNFDLGFNLLQYEMWLEIGKAGGGS
jgi:hypothetical protein